MSAQSGYDKPHLRPILLGHPNRRAFDFSTKPFEYDIVRHLGQATWKVRYNSVASRICHFLATFEGSSLDAFATGFWAVPPSCEMHPGMRKQTVMAWIFSGILDTYLSGPLETFMANWFDPCYTIPHLRIMLYAAYSILRNETKRNWTPTRLALPVYSCPSMIIDTKKYFQRVVCFCLEWSFWPGGFFHLLSEQVTVLAWCL